VEVEAQLAALDAYLKQSNQSPHITSRPHWSHVAPVVAMTVTDCDSTAATMTNPDVQPMPSQSRNVTIRSSTQPSSNSTTFLAVKPQPASTSAATPAMSREERDALVQRLLRERREKQRTQSHQQREEAPTHDVGSTSVNIATPASSGASHPFSSSAEPDERHGRSHPTIHREHGRGRHGRLDEEEMGFNNAPFHPNTAQKISQPNEPLTGRSIARTTHQPAPTSPRKLSRSHSASGSRPTSPKFSPNHEKRKGKNSASLDERLRQWQARAEESRIRKMILAQQHESKRMQECTFRPMIQSRNETAKSRTKRHAWEEETDDKRVPSATIQRLYHEADERIAIRERARQLNEEDIIASLPFKPTINASKPTNAARAPSDSTPLYQRVAELQRAKSERLQSMLLKARQEELGIREGDTDRGHVQPFKPKLNQHSMKIAEKKRQKGKGMAKSADETETDEEDDSDTESIATRHSTYSANSSLNHRLSLAQSLTAEEWNEHTFHPMVNSTSNQIALRSQRFQGPNRDFVTRQQKEVERMRMDALQRTYDAVHHPPGCTFKPEIGNAEAILEQSRKRMQEEMKASDASDSDVSTDAVGRNISTSSTQRDTSDRLSRSESRALALLKNKLRTMHDVQDGCTFKPQISAVSRKLAEEARKANGQGAEVDGALPGPTLHQQIASELLRAKSESEFARAHPFKPSLSTASEAMVESGLVQSNYPANDPNKTKQVIQAQLEAREQERQRKLKEAEENEMAQCTFHPQLCDHPTSSASSSQPVVVRGLNRFLELKSLKKRQDEEAAERAKKVFFEDVSNPRIGGKQPFTIPRPFTLSHEAHAGERQAKLAAAWAIAEAENMKECRFQPQTKVGQDRRMLRAILQQESFDCLDVTEY